MTNFADSEFKYPEAMPPRLFWRRFVAFLTDQLLLVLVLFILGFAISKIVPGAEGFSIVQFSGCKEATSGKLVEQIETLWPLKENEVRKNQYCQISQYGIVENYFETSVSANIANTTKTKFVNILIDEEGNPTTENASSYTLWMDLLVTLLMSAVPAWFISNGRNTPGKKLMALKVRTLSGEPPDLLRSLNRELLKFIFFILIMLISLVSYFTSMTEILSFEEQVNLVQSETFEALPESLWISSAFSLAALAWWILPFILWRGRTYYDQFSGCKVIYQK